jgi:hypothetical protein
LTAAAPIGLTHASVLAHILLLPAIWQALEATTSPAISTTRVRRIPRARAVPMSTGRLTWVAFAVGCSVGGWLPEPLALAAQVATSPETVCAAAPPAVPSADVPAVARNVTRGAAEGALRAACRVRAGRGCGRTCHRGAREAATFPAVCLLSVSTRVLCVSTRNVAVNAAEGLLFASRDMPLSVPRATCQQPAPGVNGLRLTPTLTWVIRAAVRAHAAPIPPRDGCSTRQQQQWHHPPGWVGAHPADGMATDDVFGRDPASVARSPVLVCS